MIIKNTTQNRLVQSPFLYLQAAGSDFSDFSARGIHLRWQLKGILADNHLPKGNLASDPLYETGIGYNKPEDFVTIYKARYTREFPVDLTLQKPPTSTVESGTIRSWTYTDEIVTGIPDLLMSVEVRFTDIGLYDLTRSHFSPMTNPGAFIQEYPGVIEIQPIGQLMFKVCLYIEKKRDTGSIQAETVSVPDLASTDQRYVSCRRTALFRNIKENNVCMTCENMEYIRYKCTEGFVSRIRIITYDNTLIGYEKSWQKIGDFSLSMNDEEVKQRLDDPSDQENQVNRQWPKFNDTDIDSGAFTVSTDNYMDRWTPASSANGIKYAVDEYLQLSRTDLLAQGSAPSSTEGDSAVNEFSYLEILNILATDYHVARMLGLGHIDQQSREAENAVHIYCATYGTRATLGPDFPAGVRLHVSMSIPTSQKDYRYPPVPELEPVTYGLTSLNGSTQPSSLTLPGGYTPDGISRFIKINQKPYPNQVALQPFFATDDEFCLCNKSIPIMYGLEYRRDDEPDFRKPELLRDSFYFDAYGYPETLPIPEQDQPGQPVFTHRETEEGIHHYALYSINWFSRSSQLSNTVPTDQTVFSRKPLPPLNLMAQFIQQENSLIFSTALEQAMLSAITGADKSLARVTFEWNQVHNDAYQFADEVTFFMRKQQPLMVRGVITNVQGLPNNRALVSTGPGTITSVTPVETVQPAVPASIAASFSGGILSAGQFLFEIESVQSTGNNPSFIVKKILQRTSVEDPYEPGSYLLSESYKSPDNAVQFTANQNLSDPAFWDARLDKNIRIEQFFQLDLYGSSAGANNKLFTVLKVSYNGSSTEITVKETIPAPAAATPGTISYKKYVKYRQTIHSLQAIIIPEELPELSTGDSVELIAAGGNSQTYTIAGVFPGNHYTRIDFTQPLPDTSAFAGVLVIDKTEVINALNGPNKKLIVNGKDLTKELIPSHREFHLIDAGESVHEFVIGGIYDTAEVLSIPDNVTGGASGMYAITIDHFVLQAPLDPDVSWYKGSVRIEEDPAFFPSTSSPVYRAPEIKVLQILSIDITGTTTKMVAYDAAFDPGSPMSNPQEDYMPIRTGTGVFINAHPGYRCYLTKANSNTSGSNPFRNADLLPLPGEGARRTLLSARSEDHELSKTSGLSAPVVLLAQEIIVPLPPEVPVGPAFATRPDVYGKSTYTFDLGINTTGGREPYAIVCYRAELRKLLTTLYLPATVQQIFTDMAALSEEDAAFFNSRFRDLANVVYDTTTHQFKIYPGGTFRFPLPDNTGYIIPNANSSIVQRPFNGIRHLDDTFTVTLYINGSGTSVTESRTMHRIVADALDGAYLPLTEQPILYKYLKDGRITSPEKPKVRSSNGELIVPGNPIDFTVFDPFPMAVKYTAGSAKKVRFTDYTIDGAADTHYFYFAVELNNKFEVSDRGPVAGPISLVNTISAEAPVVKSIFSTPANLLYQTGPTVTFSINDYIDSEKIRRIRIFRSTDHRSAASVRTMSLAKEIAVGVPIIDDFEGLTDLPYGEPLFYRIVALREILNEQQEVEYVPSKPSEISLTNIIDQVNPAAPLLSVGSDPYAPGDSSMTNVTLSWKKTVHNGSYSLYKMSVSGNWVKLAEIRTNADTVGSVLGSTDFGSPDLVKLDENGKEIYHHFKVVAANSSNLLSVEERILTV